MEKTDLWEGNNCEYTQECPKCHKKHTVYTQHDNSAEYNTEVLVECECGELVEFNLPVN